MNSVNEMFAETARVIIQILGGHHNITAVTHCVTRLRLNLADRAAVNESALRRHPAVLGVLDADTFHVIVGPYAAAPLADAVARMLEITDSPSSDPAGGALG